MPRMKQMWTQGTITAWTAHDGPTVDARPPARIWGRGIAAIWAGIFVFLTVAGCPCVEEGTCVEPMWVGALSGVILVALIPAMVGLIAHTRWAGYPSALAAAGGIGPSIWEIGHAPVLGIIELAAFGTLFVASVWLAIRSQRFVLAVRRVMAEAGASLPSAEPFEPEFRAVEQAAAVDPAMKDRARK